MTDRHSIPSAILDDLSSRFIVNIPEEERKEPIRLCFQIELAYWFYLDFLCSEDPTLKNCSMKEFTAHIFEHISYLTPLLKNLDQIIDDFRTYKLSVPTYGAILLNEDMTKVLLVQSFFSRSSWGFPKGKVNEEEDPANCAVREVMEETGLDISKLINASEYIEANINEQTSRLYVIPGINESVKCQPLTRNEIKGIEWFVIADLPCNKKDMTVKAKTGVGPKSFFMVLPFIKRIKLWVNERRFDKSVKQGRRHRHKSVGELPISFQSDSTNRNRVRPGQQLTFIQDDTEIDFENASAQKIQRSNQNQIKQPIKAQNIKRQLFAGGEESGSRFQNLDFQKTETQYFIIPRWLSFKLDRAAILKCFDD